MQEEKLILGMPTLVELPDIVDCAALCARLGLSFVELNMNLPEYQPDRIDETRIEKARDEHGVFCTIHLDENFAPCDFNPYVRDAYLRTVREAIALAKRHGMPVLNMHLHPGVHFKLPDRRVHLFAQYEAHYLDSLRRLRDVCEDVIGDSGILICVENTDGFARYAQRGIELLLESNAFGLTLDIGHAHNAKDVDLPFYKTHAEKLRHMHIHDANEVTCHLPLGKGDLDLRAAFEMAKTQRCRAVLEVKNMPGLEASTTALSAYTSL